MQVYVYKGWQSKSLRCGEEGGLGALSVLEGRQDVVEALLQVLS